MEKVQTEIEALNFCKNHHVEVKFEKESHNIPAHVVIKFSFETIIGKDLVEAVNRVVEMYKTIPNERENLLWWNEVKNFYSPKKHLIEK